MSIYHFRPRVLRWLDAKPSRDELQSCFPGQVQLFGEFEPSEPFGGPVKEGPHRFVPRAKPATVMWDANRGRYLVGPGEGFPSVNISVKFLGTDVTFEGPKFKLAVDCTGMKDVQIALGKALYLLPAWTSFVIDNPLELTYLRGQIGCFPFSYEIAEGIVQLKTTNRQSQGKKIRGLPEALQCSKAAHQRVVAALSYYNHACSLRYIDGNYFRFYPEQIVNLAKAVEALWGSNKESVRTGCCNLGLHEELRERSIIPLLSVRNSFDAAHAAISQPSEEERAVIEKTVERAFEAVRSMLTRAIDGAKDGSLTLRETSGWSRDKKKLVKELSEYVSG